MDEVQSWRVRKNLSSRLEGGGLASKIRRRFSMWNLADLTPVLGVFAVDVSDLAPVLGVCAIGLTAVCIVAIVSWYRARYKELQVQREMRIREMEHQQKMRELEVELEKAKARQAYERTA
jgi:hypothetical protein